ncbi:MAG: DUF881 domain-containing protein [Peptostreptococcaceae bacterium]|jgi:uncharacterized protein YlxW (UPF0749 family)|nr:DUF881 domain-containing protein [Peptostreptococcaceae bacterium]
MSKKKRELMIIIFSFITGLLIVMMFKGLNPGYTFVNLNSVKQMENKLESEKIKIKNLRTLIEEKQYVLERYELEISENGSLTDLIANERKDLQLISGLKDVKGSGIIIKLKDSDIPIEQFSGLNSEDIVNSLVIHDNDIIRCINELKIAGAEAISINGQRLISNSEIKCAGATITVNNKTYGQPFVIRAIGDINLLSSAVLSTDSYFEYIKNVYGINVDSYVVEQMRINSYLGDLNFDYIKEGEKN